MRSRLLLNLLLAVFLIMLALVIIYQPGSDTPAEAPLLTALDAADIQQLGIHDNRGQAIILQRQGADWILSAPFAAPGNTPRIMRLLEILKAQSHAHYPLADLDLKQLGLAPAAYQLQVNDMTLEMGGTDALQQWRYVRIGDSVHLITDRFQHLLQGAPTDFVDPTLLPEQHALTAVKLPGLQLSLRDGRWLVTGVKQQPAADSVQDFLDAWRNARALRVSRTKEPLAAANVEIHFAAVGAPLKLIMSRSRDEVVFSRPDLGLDYHFPLSSGERLLSLDTTADITTQ